MGAPPRKLLVVDDEEDLLFMVTLAARRVFTVETARDAEEGLKKARSFEPDVAVIDGILPGMDGFELCRRLRASPRTKRLPIVVLSAGDPVRGEARALAAGADRYMRKPYDQDELLSLLSALGRRGKRRQSGGASGIRTRE